MQILRKLFKSEKGATAIEYGLIAALIAVAAITAMGGLGNQLSNTFDKVKTEMAAGSNS
jgi:pilus assembly protein Flp/PilA